MPARNLWTALIVAAVFWPLSAAAAPAGVPNVTAVYQNGTVHVAWTVPDESEDFSSFRVYISHQSILGNNGIYDDYNEVPASAMSFDLKTLPPQPTLYVTVAAVNEGGEGPFISEAVVDLPRSALASSSSSSAAAVSLPPPPAVVTPTPAPAPEPQPLPIVAPSPVAAPTLAPVEHLLQLLAAHSTTETGVTLLFSDPVAADEKLSAAKLFSITDASGAVLTVKDFSVNGSIVMLTTDPQKTDVVYRISVSGLTTADGKTILNEHANTSSFLRIAEQTPTAVAAPSLPVPASVAQDVTNLQLQSQSLGGGMYSVSAEFSLPQDSAPASSFEVLQSIDGGRTYILPQTVPGTIRRLTFDRLLSGSFSVLIRTHAADGTVSHGVSQTITLGENNGTGPVASVTKALPRGLPLSSSGAGALAAFALSGAMMGWKKARKGR
jgi:hypothetical protein